MDVTLTVSGRKITLPQNFPEQLTNTEKIDRVKFQCDAEYNGFSLVAVFRNGERGKTYPVPVPADRGFVDVDPRALRRAGHLYIGMFGINGLKVLPTAWSAAIELKEGTTTDALDDEETAHVLPGIYERIDALDDAVEELADDVEVLAGDVDELSDAVSELDDAVEQLDADVDALETTVAGKQDVINDLSVIRNGAALGATALQSVPIATPDTIGGGKFSNGLGLYVMTSGAYNGQVRTYPANDNDITGRSNNYRPITPANMDTAFRTCITNPAQELTDEQKAAACATIGAKTALRYGWEQIAEITTAAGVNVDLSGYTEIAFLGAVNASGNLQLTANDGNVYLLSAIGANNVTRRFYARFEDGFLGIEPIIYRTSDNNSSVYNNGSAYMRPFGTAFNVSDIYHIGFANSSLFTSGTITIYAR